MNRIALRCLATAVAVFAAGSLELNSIEAHAQDARDTLRIGMYSRAPNRGNVYSSGSGVPSMYWWEGVFDSITRVDDKARVIPFAAEKWELVNPTTWRFTFRKDVEFSNGTKNNADNVIAMFNYLSTDGKAAGVWTAFGLGLAEWKKVDDYTVDFVTKLPNPIWPGQLARFYVAEMKAWKDMGTEAYTARPVTSGPWKPVSWTDSEGLFTAHDKSWRPGKIKNLRFIELQEQVARVQALVSGQVDIVTNMNPDDMKTIVTAGHVARADNAPNIMSFAYFSEDFSPDQKKWGGKTPFAKKEVRQAANYAINREAIVKDLFGGVTEPASQPANPQTFGYNPDVKPYPYDPAKARALLTQAGYPNGFNMVAEVIVGAIANDREIYQYMVDQLGQVGIKVDLRPLVFADWLKKLIGKSWEGEATGFSYLVDPVMDASGPFSWYSCQRPQKFICIEEHMPLIEAQAKEMDRGKREVLLKELMKRANEDALSIAVLNGKDIFGVAKRVQGFTNWNRVLVYENMSF